jgi:hypothetical protein
VNRSYTRRFAFAESNFLVDDGLASLGTESVAVHLVMESRDKCAPGGLLLHTFISNSKVVVESIYMSERAADVKDLDLFIEVLTAEKALDQVCIGGWKVTILGFK